MKIAEMSHLHAITHRFVENIPDEVDEGTLYVSIPYATAIHNCFCGCGEEVVTPISPTGWTLTFDGDTVSLKPSIGNWSLPCRSHYWITNNRVRWAGEWTQEAIDAARAADRRSMDRYFAVSPSIDRERPAPQDRWWRRLKRRVGRQWFV
jgi:hypothetical protein